VSTDTMINKVTDNVNSSTSSNEATPLLDTKNSSELRYVHKHLSPVTNDLTTTASAQENDCRKRPSSIDNEETVVYTDEIPCSTSSIKYWKEYNRLLESNPIEVKAITATFILSFADFIAQVIEHVTTSISTNPTTNNIDHDNVFLFDWLRTIRFGVFGCIGAPWSHFYFFYLDKYLPPTDNPCTVTTAIKVFIDQFIQAPILLALMISSLSLMSGVGLNGMKYDLRSNYVDSLIANCKSVDKRFFLDITAVF
jgi:hypothetical protein